MTLQEQLGPTPLNVRLQIDAIGDIAIGAVKEPHR
jgi:hypothetical protein